MKIVIITGSYPPDVCGVADYTARLSATLRSAGVDVDVVTGKRWDLLSAVSLSREVRRLGPDLVHIQYPATGYGWQLGPQALSLLLSAVVTIHECSQSHVLRRLSLYPFSIRSRAIVFTNDYERRYALRFAPWVGQHSVVIPIGVNSLPSTRPMQRLPGVVVHFGLIRPQKGLEEVLEMARIFKERECGMRVRIVGTVLPGSESYYAELRKEAAHLPVEWVLGLNGSELGNVLAESWVAYQPFPDGASERRSSLIAMLMNQVAIITTQGPHTPPDMAEAVQFAGSPREAAAIAEELFSDTPRLRSQQSKTTKYAQKFSWDTIAAEHINLYRGILTHP